MPRAPLSLSVVAVVALGCYAQEAARRSADRIEAAWNYDERGPAILATGPAMTTWAVGELAVQSLRRPPEPRRQWFRNYTGAWEPLERVALLCHANHATNATALLDLGSGELEPARHARWHYPECLEVRPGHYRVQVHYYERRSVDREDGVETETLESSRPAVVDWNAQAGGAYRLSAELGQEEPAPEAEAAFFRAPPRPGTPGTTAHEVEARSFSIRIEALGSRAELGDDVFAARERWRQWEEAEP
jgi:hypothetical protein